MKKEKELYFKTGGNLRLYKVGNDFFCSPDKKVLLELLKKRGSSIKMEDIKLFYHNLSIVWGYCDSFDEVLKFSKTIENEMSFGYREKFIGYGDMEKCK